MLGLASALAPQYLGRWLRAPGGTQHSYWVPRMRCDPGRGTAEGARVHTVPALLLSLVEQRFDFQNVPKMRPEQGAQDSGDEWHCSYSMVLGITRWEPPHPPCTRRHQGTVAPP